MKSLINKIKGWKIWRIFKKKPKKTKKVAPPYKTTPVRVRLVVSDDDENLEELTKQAAQVDGVKRVKTNRSAEDAVFESLNGSSRRDDYRFEPNSKYTTIWIYAIVFIVVAVLFGVGIANGTIVAGIKKFFTAISPFIAGLFVGLILDRPISNLDAQLFDKLFKIKSVRARRILSILVCYLILSGLIFVVIYFIVPQLAKSIEELSKKGDDFINAFDEIIQQIEEFIPGMQLGDLQNLITEKTPQIMESITNFAPKLVGFAGQVLKTGWNIIISFIVSIYILYDKRNLKVSALRSLYASFAIGKSNRISQTINDCTDIFVNFVFGKSLDSLIIGILSFIVLKIFNYPYALLIAVIIGITNMIPYFGPFIGAVPGFLLYLADSGIKPALIFCIIVFVIQQLDGWVIGPKIVGDSTGLSPLWVVCGSTLGGAYGGVIGMFLGVPVVAVLSFLISRIIDTILERRKVDVS